MAKPARKARTRAVPEAPARLMKGVAAPSGAAAAAARSGTRAKRSAERRDAILAAALDEFAARGFAATRLEDVANRANVAKGTIYLHFADKETLFQELIRMELSPVVGALEQASHADIPFRQVTDQLIEVFVREIFETRRKDVIRLVITEGPRFPKLAEFYYREVISRVHGDDPRHAAPRPRARRAQDRRAGAFPATAGGARHRRDHLERVVRSLRAARYPRDDAGAFRRAVRRQERAHERAPHRRCSASPAAGARRLLERPRIPDTRAGSRPI